MPRKECRSFEYVCCRFWAMVSPNVVRKCNLSLLPTVKFRPGNPDFWRFYDTWFFFWLTVHSACSKSAKFAFLYRPLPLLLYENCVPMITSCSETRWCCNTVATLDSPPSSGDNRSCCWTRPVVRDQEIKYCECVIQSAVVDERYIAFASSWMLQLLLIRPRKRRHDWSVELAWPLTTEAKPAFSECVG